MDRVHQGMRPKTRASYERSFHLFIAFTIYMKMSCPWKLHTLLAFFEYLASNTLSAATLQNYVSVLNHYFKLYGWSTVSLASRQVLLFIKSVKMNSKMQIKLKGIFTLAMLEELLHIASQCQNGIVFQALFSLAFFGFFRLASLVPAYENGFDSSRFPLVLDVVWAPPGVQMILKHAKNMQGANEFRVVYIPRLNNDKICPVKALQVMIRTMNLVHSDPLFMIQKEGHRNILTAFKVRSVLAKMVQKMGLYPQEFGFHAFRRSGASLAFNANVPLEYIKVHGHWKSNAVWTYLKNAPKAAAVVASTFQNLVT